MVSTFDEKLEFIKIQRIKFLEPILGALYSSWVGIFLVPARIFISQFSWLIVIDKSVHQYTIHCI